MTYRLRTDRANPLRYSFLTPTSARHLSHIPPLNRALDPADVTFGGTLGQTPTVDTSIRSHHTDLPPPRRSPYPARIAAHCASRSVPTIPTSPEMSSAASRPSTSVGNDLDPVKALNGAALGVSCGSSSPLRRICPLAGTVVGGGASSLPASPQRPSWGAPLSLVVSAPRWEPTLTLERCGSRWPRRS